MNPTDLLSWLDTLAHQQPGLAAMAELWLKSVVIVSCSFFAITFLNSLSASTRNLVWRMVFAALFALPFLRAFLPDVAIAVHAYHHSTEVLASAQNVDKFSTASFSLVVVAGYVLITTLLLTYLVSGLAKTIIISRQAKPLNVDRISSLLQKATTRNGSSQSIELLISDGITSPVTWGVRKHQIIFPPAVVQWSDELVEQIIGHELGHIQRNDWVQQLISRLVVCFYWPNPLTLIASKNMALEAEKACDDFAIDDTGCRISYAENLLWLTQQLKTPVKNKLVLGFIGTKHVLIQRIKYILSENKRQHRIDRDSCVPGLLLAVVLAAPFAATSFTVEKHALASNTQVFAIKYHSNKSTESQLFRNELKRYSSSP